MRARGALLLAALLACACGASSSGRRSSLALPLRRRRLQSSSLGHLQSRARADTGARSLLAQATAQLPLDANDWGQGCVDAAGAAARSGAAPLRRCMPRRVT